VACFDGRLREQCLNIEALVGSREASVMVSNCRREGSLPCPFERRDEGPCSSPSHATRRVRETTIPEAVIEEQGFNLSPEAAQATQARHWSSSIVLEAPQHHGGSMTASGRHVIGTDARTVRSMAAAVRATSQARGAKKGRFCLHAQAQCRAVCRVGSQYRLSRSVPPLPRVGRPAREPTLTHTPLTRERRCFPR
jgi:hypothetical protein